MHHPKDLTATSATVKALRAISLLAMLFSTIIAAPNADALEGKSPLEQFRRMQQVDVNLLPGMILPPEMLAKTLPNNSWVQIPDWLAGTWQHKTYTTVGGFDYVINKPLQSPMTVKDEVTRTYGMQRDRNGGYWHYMGSPSSYTLQSRKTWSLIRDLGEEWDYNQQRVLVRRFGTDTTISKPRNEVIDTSQNQTIDRYEPAGDGLIHIESRSNSYDRFGTLTRAAENARMIKRIQKFKKIDQQDGQNLKILFFDYLTAIHRPHLIPDR